MQWWKKRRTGSGSPANVIAALRAQALDLDPASVGLTPSPDFPRIFGGVVDTAYDIGVLTLVALVDGTTSLYPTAGVGIIGGGSHESVVTEARSFLEALDAHLDELGDETHTALPEPDWAVIHALTYSGRRSARAGTHELGEGRHVLSPVFDAAHRAIWALRQIDSQG